MVWKYSRLCILYRVGNSGCFIVGAATLDSATGRITGRAGLLVVQIRLTENSADRQPDLNHHCHDTRKGAEVGGKSNWRSELKLAEGRRKRILSGGEKT